MRKTIVAVTCALLLLGPLVLLAWGFLVPSQYSDSFMGELKYKTELLQNTPGPRIILVGGSGAAFGVDCGLLEGEIEGYKAVNFGMYAALGTSVMLDLSAKYIRPGDIVILMPEENSQALSEFFDPAVMLQGLDGAWGMLRDLPMEKLERLLGAFPDFAAEKFGLYLKGGPELQGVYRRDSFDEWGTVCLPDGAANDMPGGWDAAAPVDFDALEPAEDFKARVTDWANTLRDRGARVYFALCPVNALARTGDPETFAEKLGLPVLGNPNDSLMAPGWFYDTNFHLNTSGKIAFTRTLAGALKALLGDSRPLGIPLLTVPELGSREAFHGNDMDAGLFVIRDGTVVGLTAEGRERPALTVPTFAGDEEVTSIAAGAFSGAKAGEVTIQKNIRTVADGAFSGAQSLERIIMENSVPSSCRIGQGLLEGTGADVLVPEGSLSAYRTDYFWSVLGLRVREN